MQRDLVQELRKLIEPDPQAVVIFQGAHYENDGKRKQSDKVLGMCGNRLQACLERVEAAIAGSVQRQGDHVT